MCKEKIKRGDIYYADLSPVVGREQGGTRPVLILQNDIGNLHSETVIVAAMTSKIDKLTMPTHVYVNNCGLNKDSLVLLEQIRTIDRSRLQGHLGTLSSNTMLMINKALSASVGLSDHENVYGNEGE